METEMSVSSPSATDFQRSEAHQTSRDTDSDGFQIFLGGSCNPTTWRQNLAIPYLEKNGISYYNPQVENWTPEAVNTERYAKQNAKVLLFVIDKQTRSTVGLVESAYMAGKNKNLVVVIYPFDYHVLNLNDTSKPESTCIQTRSKLVTASRTISKKNDNSSLVESSSLSSATLISRTSSSQSNITSTTTRASTTKTTSCKAHLNPSVGLGSDPTNLESVCKEFKVASESIRINGEAISLGEFHELRRARYLLQNLVTTNKIPIFTDILQALKYVSCNIKKNPNDHFLEELRQPSSLIKTNSPLNLLDQQFPISKDCVSTKDYLMKDVYLSLGIDDCTCLESSVIPFLKEKGLTYNYTCVNKSLDSNPAKATTVEHSNSLLESVLKDKGGENDHTRYSNALEVHESTRLDIEKELCAIKSSRVLLFVITNRCRGLSIMVLASHFMALFRNHVVLCVQYLEEPCSVGDETLTKTAIADYNRGRVYLCDYATKSQVPVFNTIQEAVDCCSRKCQYVAS